MEIKVKNVMAPMAAGTDESHLVKWLSFLYKCIIVSTLTKRMAAEIFHGKAGFGNAVFVAMSMAVPAMNNPIAIINDSL